MDSAGRTPTPERVSERASQGDSDTVVERYRTLYPLGRGGMGAVDVALERQGTGFERIVALKRLLPDAKAKHAEMFLREARVAALLDHPNVVRAFDYGELDGELFMTMEYVEGEPLSRVIAVARDRGASLDWEIVAHLVADVCDGLHAAHELVAEDGSPLRVVHRDVSPHNVMVAYDGHVKLLDFGVAKIDAGDGLTRTGEVKGKAAYMSPEQAMGEPLDRRSDLYSVGAVLFEALTGRRMWEGTDMEVMRKLALHAPPRLDELAPRVPPALARLYERLVSRSPDERPASAADVAHLLREIVGASATASESVANMMAELFADAALRRRAELESALASLDPSQLTEVRKSLAPPVVATRSSSARRASVAPRKRTIEPVWIVAAVLAAMVVALVAARLQSGNASASQGPKPSDTSATSRAETSFAPPLPKAPSSPIPPRDEAPGAPQPSSATHSSSATSPPAEAAKKAKTDAAKPKRVLQETAPKPPPSAAPSTKPLDVDPHAI